MTKQLQKLLSRLDKNTGKGKTVLLALSGGVDSSVAAYLLKYQGYKVIGAFMKNWSDTKNKITGECTWRSERREAIKSTDILNIPLKTFDFEDEYKKEVIDPMFKAYQRGLTPNPDVDCNQRIKFPLFWKKAKKLGADYMATGHFIRRVPENGKINFEKSEHKESKHKESKHKESEHKESEHKESEKYKLLRATYEQKDQSYFLYKLTQKEIENCLFPIGYYTKQELRFIAKEIGLKNYDKRSTRGICFVGKVNLKQFLQQKIKEKKGKLKTPEGKIVGEHDGIMYYTIGQRIGPRYGIDFKKQPGKQSEQRWYIANKIAKTNAIIVAPEGHKALFRKNIAVKQPQFHFISENKEEKQQKLAKSNQKVLARIRHVGELLPANLSYNKAKKTFEITLNKAIMGVAQGQSVVLYNKDEVIGGGEIVFPELL